MVDIDCSTQRVDILRCAGHLKEVCSDCIMLSQMFQLFCCRRLNFLSFGIETWSETKYTGFVKQTHLRMSENGDRAIREKLQPILYLFNWPLVEGVG